MSALPLVLLEPILSSLLSPHQAALVKVMRFEHVALQPVLMIGVFFTALSTLMFGLADSFAMAVTARVVGGLFSSTGV